ncbi:hypothetical protein [Calothrix sp. PCC 7507]|uniref:hypothetical protein n=1 Tax=Calothrix sp. PCC 7507 TaxID=99598 RepID=UPI00029EF6C6|nr:hypothetical protein [Calothrix sp. PCC 7507]AFY34508.1 hypothetical protein Cal7507_4128 [Calothrix sp. PCC 7507]
MTTKDMITKELLIQEIESLPAELLTQTLDFIRFIKISHGQSQLNTDEKVKKHLYPLHNTQPYRYDDPTEPIALEDWEFLQ